MSDFLTRFLGAEPGFESEIVQRYSDRLLALARRQLPERIRKRVDPEDVVQSVYRSFFRRLNEGRFSFDDSHDVWRLLAAMTFHKARNTVKFHQRNRRDVRREVPLSPDGSSQAAEPFHATPSSEDVNVLFRCLEQLIAGLPENYREIVVLRLEGQRIEQIASQVKRSRRTVLRVLSRLHDLAAQSMERT